MNPMIPYLVAFAIDLWSSRWGRPPGQHRRDEIVAIAEDVASTDSEPLEALQLMNIAAWESNYERNGRPGPGGERGAFQVHPPASSYGAKEALWRLRNQGIWGYMGCRVVTERCVAMADRRTFPAELYLWSHDPPATSVQEVVALDP